MDCSQTKNLIPILGDRNSLRNSFSAFVWFDLIERGWKWLNDYAINSFIVYWFVRELETKKAGSFLKTGEIGQVSKVRSISQIYLIKQIFYCLFFLMISTLKTIGKIFQSSMKSNRVEEIKSSEPLKRFSNKQQKGGRRIEAK